MTAHWENKLTEISEQTCRYEDFMAPLKEVIHTYINELITTPLKQISNVKQTPSFKKKRPRGQTRQRSSQKT